MPSDSVSNPHDEGIIRVFVSSTFRDMQAERDALVRFAFPELQRRCRERGVEFSAIDLRWGITAEQAARGEVLEVCLDEINRCRPFFIGIMGSRYGWVPDSIDPRVLDDHEWLKLHTGASITELEWRHGALNDPAATVSFFYLRQRDPGIDGTEMEPDPSEAADAALRLAGLEEAVRKAEFPVRDGFDTPEGLSALVLDDLWREIERVIPADGSSSDTGRRSRAQRIFLESRLRFYVPRPEYYALLDGHVAGGGAPLLVSGGAGAGKSALLANWADLRRRGTPGSTVVFHSVAATPGSTDYRELVRALIEQLGRAAAGGGVDPMVWIGGYGALSDDDLIPTLGAKLTQTAAQGDVVLVIDGLDQMRDAADASDLLWLPDPMPGNVSVIVSARRGSIADRLAGSGLARLDVAPLTEPEREEMITGTLLVLHRKRLDDRQTRLVARAPQAANPLFLKTFLEELSLLGSFELLDQSIGHYLSADSTGELVDLILERCEHDYDPTGQGYVEDAMTAIWASERGLLEPELLAACSIPQALWSPLRMALQESLVSYSGMMGFSHDEIADAVAARYLPSPAERRGAHGRLADFFASEEVNDRTATELLYQLDAAEDWQRLMDALLNLPVLFETWEIAKPAVVRYWRHVEEATGTTPSAAYSDVVERPESYPSLQVWAVASLLMNMGYTDESLPLQVRLVDETRREGDLQGLQAALGNLAVSLFLERRHEEALTCHDEEERLCRDLEEEQDLQMCLGNKANVFIALERWDEAQSALDEAIRICRALGDTEQLARRLVLLAEVLHETGDLVAAERMLGEAVPVLEAAGDPLPIEAAAQRLNDLGVALKNAEHYELAERCYGVAERLARALGRESLLILTVMNRGVVLGRMRRTDEAIDVLAEAEALARAAGSQDTLMKCLFNRAWRLMEAGRSAEVITALDEAMQIARETGQEEMLPHMENMASGARSQLW